MAKSEVDLSERTPKEPYDTTFPKTCIPIYVHYYIDHSDWPKVTPPSKNKQFSVISTTRIDTDMLERLFICFQRFLGRQVQWNQNSFVKYTIDLVGRCRLITILTISISVIRHDRKTIIFFVSHIFWVDKFKKVSNAAFAQAPVCSTFQARIARKLSVVSTIISFISCLWAAILDFWLLYTSHNMGNSSANFLQKHGINHYNCAAMYCIQAEIGIFSVVFHKKLAFATTILDFWVTIYVQQLCHFVAQKYLGKVTRAFLWVPCSSEMATKRFPWSKFNPLDYRKVIGHIFPSIPSYWLQNYNIQIINN